MAVDRKSMHKGEQGGFTLFEVMVAILLLAMVSTMIYSILNVSIKFSEKGEEKIFRIERKQGLLSLIERQIRCALYDRRSKKALLSAEESVLRVTTRSPLLYPEAGTVLAVYRFDQADGSLYYQEKRDYYNADYQQDYIPDYDEMVLLFEKGDPLLFEYDEDLSAVSVSYADEEYLFTAWCGGVLEDEEAQQ